MKMSRKDRFLLGLGAIIGIVLLIACCFFGLRSNHSSSSDSVNKNTHTITTVDIPPKVERKVCKNPAVIKVKLKSKDVSKSFCDKKLSLGKLN